MKKVSYTYIFINPNEIPLDICRKVSYLNINRILEEINLKYKIYKLMQQTI